MVFHTELAIRPAKRPDPMDEIRGLKTIECGKEAAKHFALGEGYRNLNHGMADLSKFLPFQLRMKTIYIF